MKRIPLGSCFAKTLTSLTATQVARFSTRRTGTSGRPIGGRISVPSLLTNQSDSSSLFGLGQKRHAILVESNATPNPECLRFFSMELSFLPPGTAMDLPNEGHAYKSPLAEHLFKLWGVKELYFADEYITVTKEEQTSWDELSGQIKEIIIAFSESGENILAPEISTEYLSNDDDTEPAEGDDEVVLALKELLHTRIRPMLKADGGNVKFVGIEDGQVFVMLEGACKTCPSSNTTLKVGIERMLMHWIPEVTEVLEVDGDWAYDFKRQQEEKKKAEAEAAANGNESKEPTS